MTSRQDIDTIREAVAEALYERAMSERRTFSREPQKFTKRWSDEPYVGPFDGTPRASDWRDDWRDEASTVLAALSRVADRAELEAALEHECSTFTAIESAVDDGKTGIAHSLAYDAQYRIRRALAEVDTQKRLDVCADVRIDESEKT